MFLAQCCRYNKDIQIEYMVTAANEFQRKSNKIGCYSAQFSKIVTQMAGELDKTLWTYEVGLPTKFKLEKLYLSLIWLWKVLLFVNKLGCIVE